MANELSTEAVWDTINKEIFAVIGMVTQKNEARTVGIVYVVVNRKLYIATEIDTWKARHVMANSSVSVTIPIAKRIPLMPWIKIPAATITFSGHASVIPAKDAQDEILKLVFRSSVTDPDVIARTCIIEVTPEKEFVTYGVGIPLMKMRFPEQSRGRVPVG